MAITRRQFVTRMGALAGAMGMSQADLSKVVEAFAHGSVWDGGWADKPKVVWVHGAECTGCSTSLLSLFEEVRGTAIEGTSYTTLKALDLAVGGDGDGTNVIGTRAKNALGINVVANPNPAGHPYSHRTLYETDAANPWAAPVGCDFDGNKNASPYVANIADVLIDFIDLQYHETVMGMGGDLAYKWLNQLVGQTASTTPFVLVVEGAVQPHAGGGYWGETAASGDAPWCSIGMGETSGELKFDDVVKSLAKNTACKAVIPIGQCACYGGYPACSSPVLANDVKGKANGGNMTGAKGVHAYLAGLATTGTDGINPADKVVNVPGCPTNPWWFVLTVVAWLVDFTQAGEPLKILDSNKLPKVSAVDRGRRLKAVYGIPLHGPYCARYQSALNGVFATKPGEAGCLQLIGCKGPGTGTLCGPHGWNGQNPRNFAQDEALDYGVGAINGKKGGNCVAGGHPCMACTEPGYPDAFLPFVVR